MIAISFSFSKKKEKQISDKTVNINIHIFFSANFFILTISSNTYNVYLSTKKQVCFLLLRK